MSPLRLVRNDRPAALTVADLTALGKAAELLGPLEDAVRELRAGVQDRDLELTMRASRRLLGFGGLFGAVGEEIELLLREELAR